MKKILVISALLLSSTSLMAAEETDSKEHKVTVTATFNFKAGDVLSKEEISERLRIEELRNQQIWNSFEKRDMQTSKYFDEAKKAERE